MAPRTSPLRDPRLLFPAIAASVLLTSCRERPTSAPGAPEAEPPGAAVAEITGPCAEAPALPTASDAWGAVSPVEASSCFDLTAEGDPLLLPADPLFTFTSTVPLQPADVEALLAVSPAVGIHAAPAGADAAGAFRVTLADRLAPGTPVQFTMLSGAAGRPLDSWAFQAAAPLRVVSSIPGDGSASVPVTTGIELAMSHDGATGIEEGFSIHPAVEGAFETRGRTVAFVPAAPLAHATLYTVTLTSGVTAPGAEPMAGPYTFAFETEPENPNAPSGPAYRFTRKLWQVPPSEAPVLSGYGDRGAAAGTAVSGAIYRYHDLDAFQAALDDFTAIPAWAWQSSESYQAPVDTLAQVATFDATLEPIGDTGELTVALPQALEEGAYLVELAVPGGTSQAWVQSTPLSEYTSVSEGKLLVWLHDLTSGTPGAGAAVELGDGTPIGTTSADGLLLATTPPEMVDITNQPWGRQVALVGSLVASLGGHVVVVPMDDRLAGNRPRGFSEFGRTGPTTDYWRYFYTDRRLYRRADTVHFWGVAKPREGDPLAEVTVALTGGGATTYAGTPAEIGTVTVPVSPRGTYEGEIRFDGASAGFYDLAVRDGEDLITSLGVEVRDFETPAYRIDLTTTPAVAYADEPVTVTAKAAFFDDTPMPNLALSLHHAYSEGDVAQEGVTNEVGEVSFPLTHALDAANEAIAWPQVVVRPVAPEDGDIQTYASVMVVAGERLPDFDATVAEGAATLEGHVYQVDLDALERDAARVESEWRNAPAAGAVVTGTVTMVESVQEVVGQVYDPISKQNVPEYEYHEVRTPMEDFTATAAADGSFRHSFPVEGDKSYEVRVATHDDAGRAASVVRWVYGGATGQEDRITLEGQAGPFAVGATVPLTLTQSEAPLAGKKSYLFYEAQNGVRAAAVEPAPFYALRFDDAAVPNVAVVGVAFDGRTYEEADAAYVADFDQSTRGLQVTLEAGAPSYAPGDAAKLTVRVTGPDGAPAAAEVLLSAVDEAVLRLQGGTAFDDADILTKLYAPVGTGVLKTYASHEVPTGRAQPEGGGGGDSRQDFQDTALFQTVEVGASGTAEVTFPLPDNLTSWAVSGIAVTDDLFAGNGAARVPVSLPVFVDLSASDTYLTGDQPDLRLRAFGTALAEGEAVHFTLEAPTLLGKPAELDGVAFASVRVPVPALPEGTHVITASVTAAGGSDRLVQRIHVVPSRLAAADTTSQTVAEGAALDVPGNGPSLTVSDAGRGAYLGDLEALATTSGDRVEQVTARVAAAKLLHDLFDGPLPGEPPPTGLYQKPEGGLALVPYGDPDVDATVAAATADPDAWGRQTMTGYLTSVVDDPDETRERKATALHGLAALGEPVLGPLQGLAGATDLSTLERLHVGLGLARAGDLAGARGQYNVVLASAERRGDMARVNVDGANAAGDASLIATALAADLGAALNDPYGPLFYRYVTANTPEGTLVDLERVTFLADTLARLPVAPARVAVTVDGVRHEANLAAGAVTFDAFQQAHVDALAGDALVSTTGLVAVEPTNTGTSGLGVTRVIARADGPAGDGGPVTLGEADRVRITLTADLGAAAEEGCYQLTDLVPSGLRPITSRYDPSAYHEEGTPTDGPYFVDGQRVSFCVYPSDKSYTRSYLARVQGTGTFGAEPALIQSMPVPSEKAFSGAETVTVTPQ